MQEAVARGTFFGMPIIPQYLVLEVCRENLVSDTIYELRKFAAADLKKPLKVGDERTCSSIAQKNGDYNTVFSWSGQIPQRGSGRCGRRTKGILHAAAQGDSRPKVRHVYRLPRDEDDLVFRTIPWGARNVLSNRLVCLLLTSVLVPPTFAFSFRVRSVVRFGNLQFHHHQPTFPASLVQKVVGGKGDARWPRRPFPHLVTVGLDRLIPWHEWRSKCFSSSGAGVCIAYSITRETTWTKSFALILCTLVKCSEPSKRTSWNQEVPTFPSLKKTSTVACDCCSVTRFLMRFLS